MSLENVAKRFHTYKNDCILVANWLLKYNTVSTKEARILNLPVYNGRSDQK